MNPADNIERAIEEMHLTTDAATDRRILADSFAALEGATRSGAAGRRPVRRITLTSPVVSFAAAAAAVVMIAALFLNYARQKSIGLRTLYAALGEVTSLSIARYTPGQDKPYQQEWASQNLNASMLKLADAVVLWDLANATGKTKRPGSNSARSGMIPEKVFSDTMYRMSHNFGLVPFPDINHIPDDVQWAQVTEPDALSVGPDTDVYDLVWTKSWPETEVRKQRYFLNASTNLPVRIEIYARAESESEFRFLRYDIVTYLSDSEVESAVAKEFGAVSDYGSSNDPEYMGTPESYPRVLP